VRLAAKGEVSLPFGADERKAKFLDCARFSGLPADQAHALFARSNSPAALDAAGLASFSLS
jgi:hypothetical protein